MENYSIKLSYLKANSGAIEFITKDNKYSNEDLSLQLIDNGDRVKLHINTVTSIAAINVALIFDIPKYERTQFYSNGYQSWSYSREYCVKDKYYGINPLMKPFVKIAAGQMVGDYTFVKYPKHKGIFNSCSHCYIREGGSSDIQIYGSHDDRMGYTYFTADLNKNNMVITRDLEGLSLDIGEYDLLDIHVISDEYNTAWDRYFAAIGVSPRSKRKLRGYTSWYNYYRNINEEILTRDLDNLVKQDIKEVNIFQIDDGYQTHVGDLTTVDAKKFPQGMQHMSQLIHFNGLLAGIWVCPFCVTPWSQTFRHHRDWLLKNSAGLPIKASGSWGGCYALDFYNPEAREYIRSSLKTIVNDWGYDMLKLDFLYAACIVPRNGKTRAMIMYDVMEFLRETVGDDILLLACGAPLMPCYNVVDYCRIGADITLGWSNILDKYLSRELLSTRKTIINTVFRRYLDNRAFMNDPDVFILRNFNTSLLKNQQRILYSCNKLFGSVLFISDDVGSYDDDSLNQLKLIFKDSDVKLLGADIIDKDTLFIRYELNNCERIFVFNYNTSELLRDQSTK